MLSPEEIERYARHIVLREVGGPGQARLKAARVLVGRAGGDDAVRGARLSRSGIVSVVAGAGIAVRDAGGQTLKPDALAAFPRLL